MSPNDANRMLGNYFFKAVLQEAFRKFKLSADVKSSQRLQPITLLHE